MSNNCIVCSMKECANGVIMRGICLECSRLNAKGVYEKVSEADGKVVFAEWIHFEALED